MDYEKVGADCTAGASRPPYVAVYVYM